MKPIFGGEGEDIAEYWRFEVRGLGSRTICVSFLTRGLHIPGRLDGSVPGFLCGMYQAR
jgi:hypothetical protein